MARTRKIIDAKDLNTGELAFFNSHAKVTYMSDGSTVEDSISKKQDIISDLDNIRNNAALGATALQTVPAGYATETFVKNKVAELVGSAPDTLNTLEELATALKNDKDVVDVLNDAINSTKNLIEVTYSELKSLRDNSQLVPGCQYCITDYQCTTVEENTKSAGNQFDIIVTANSESTLSHLAKATLHEGDTYFTSCDLEAWQLWYDIDNNADKYAWADEENGRGVIYRMIDEHNNDCPYDFKNIMFYTDKYTENTTEDNHYYTFSYVIDNVLYDGTVQVKICYGNRMNGYSNEGKFYLNGNIFRNTDFENYCVLNTLGNECYSNTFGDYCNSNVFGDYCYSNVFGYGFYANTFGNDCNSNTFGNDCNSNTFGNECSNNTFGNYCYSNVFGNYCYSNVFGNECSNNTLGNCCESNNFGKNCDNNILGNECSNNTFGNYYTNIEFGNNCNYINLNSYIATTSGNNLQNIRITNGLQGRNGYELTITADPGLSRNLVVTKDIKGNIIGYFEGETTTSSGSIDTIAGTLNIRDINAVNKAQQKLSDNESITYIITDADGNYPSPNNSTVYLDNEDIILNLLYRGNNEALKWLLKTKEAYYYYNGIIGIGAGWYSKNISNYVKLPSLDLQTAKVGDFVTLTKHIFTAEEFYSKFIDFNSISIPSNERTQLNLFLSQVGISTKLSDGEAIKQLIINGHIYSADKDPQNQGGTTYQLAELFPDLSNERLVIFYTAQITPNTQNIYSGEFWTGNMTGPGIYSYVNAGTPGITNWINPEKEEFIGYVSKDGTQTLVSMKDPSNTFTRKNLKDENWQRTGVGRNFVYYESYDENNNPGGERIQGTGEIFNDYINNMAHQDHGHAEGQACSAEGWNSHAEGFQTVAGEYGVTGNAHSEGNNTWAGGNNSHAEGVNTIADGHNSHAEGDSTIASNWNAHAEGYRTYALGNGAHAEGNSDGVSDEECWNVASGFASHTEGNGTRATNKASHAEGIYTSSEGQASHSEGWLTFSKGTASHTEGGATQANADASHAEGYYTIANNTGEHAEGLYNYHKIDNLIHSVGIGDHPNDDINQIGSKGRVNAHAITLDGKHYIYGIGGYEGKGIENALDLASCINNCIKITYVELKSLKDNSKLIPGMLYHITDYTCTTTQENTISAGHQFDIIVTANSSNSFNETAKALLHDGDEYFANCNLNAWELKYCFDNDTNKFSWADPENGKGVIYYMKDEYNNECSYDFKNIQYLNEEKYFYTFSNLFDGILDDSINPYNDINYCYNNKIAPCRYEGILILNNIYFKNTMPLAKCRNNNIGVDCKNITFGSECSDNVFTLNCKDIILGDECGDNVFKNDCINITLGKDCNRNIFDCDNEYITFGKDCNDNILSQRCSDITFDNDCCSNNMYQYCCVITLGKSCNNNMFYQNCNTNTLGSYCDNNIFYQHVICCDLGDYNESIVFGSNCDSCVINTDSSNDALRPYCNNISFNSGCSNIKIYHSLSEYSTSEKTLKNIKVISSLTNEVIGLDGIVNLENNEYITNIAKNSGGILKIYCEADLIN